MFKAQLPTVARTWARVNFDVWSHRRVKADQGNRWGSGRIGEQISRGHPCGLDDFQPLKLLGSVPSTPRQV